MEDVERITLQGKVPEENRKEAEELAAELTARVLEELPPEGFDGPGHAIWTDIGLRNGQVAWEIRPYVKVEEEYLLTKVPFEWALENVPEEFREAVLLAAEEGYIPGGSPEMDDALETFWSSLEDIANRNREDLILWVDWDERAIEVWARETEYEPDRDGHTGTRNLQEMVIEDLVAQLAS